MAHTIWYIGGMETKRHTDTGEGNMMKTKSEIIKAARNVANENRVPMYVFETVHGYTMDECTPGEDVNGSAILNGVLEILPVEICEDCEEREAQAHNGPWGRLCKPCEQDRVDGLDDRAKDAMGINNASWH